MPRNKRREYIDSTSLKSTFAIGALKVGKIHESRITANSYATAMASSKNRRCSVCEGCAYRISTCALPETAAKSCPPKLPTNRNIRNEAVDHCFHGSGQLVVLKLNIAKSLLFILAVYDIIKADARIMVSHGVPCGLTSVYLTIGDQNCSTKDLSSCKGWLYRCKSLDNDISSS